jgi:hypothetical protein
MTVLQASSERCRKPARAAGALLAVLLAPTGGSERFQWDARRAEHLWNRAGFGAGTAAIERWVELGPEGAVEELLAPGPWIEEPFYARKRADGDLGRLLRSLPEAEREQRMEDLRAEDRAQASDFLAWWVERMLAGDEPLRERMVLFWHGYFTSSYEVVKSSYEMIQQNQLFRRHALGSFRALLHGIARDPAMLVYLDNASSKRSKPNENFARELMELYTLGEGHYGEDDVREVARAFTGWSQRNGRFHLDQRQHDGGSKRVLGRTGRLDGADVIAILLAQEACARHLAQALLTHFEGVPPDAERLERYASSLRASDYRIDSFLRQLFLDPGFYSEERRARRVSSPLGFLVGSARRLGAAPDAAMVVTCAGLLGERLFHPPSVRGWEGGEAWATGAGLLLRGELMGLLMGRVRGRELVGELRDELAARFEGPPPEADGETAMLGTSGAMEGAGAMDARRRRRIPPELRALTRFEARPRFNLTQRVARTGAATDVEVARALVDELLAVPASEALVARVAARLGAAREEHGLGQDAWTEDAAASEPVLRELAHGILSLPEAQLD